MGTKNPDRVPLAYRRARCETVADMLAQGWEVISSCRTCNIELRTDLKLIALVRGPETSLWNRNARCKRLLCPGWVVFKAKAPGMTWFEELAADNCEPDLPAWRRAHPGS